MNPLVPGYTNMVLHFRPICDLNKEHFLSYANISQLLFLDLPEKKKLPYIVF